MAESGSTGKTPVSNYAQTGSSKSAAQANTPMAKQGRGEGTYAGVKGNVHEMPNPNQPESTNFNEPVVADSFDVQKPAPTPTISEMLRPTEESRFVATQQYDSSALKQQYANLAQDQSLLKLGSLGGKLQAIIAKNMTQLWTAQTEGAPGDKTGSVTDALKASDLDQKQQQLVADQLEIIDQINAGTYVGTGDNAQRPGESAEAYHERIETAAIGAIGTVMQKDVNGVMTVNWDLMKQIIPTTEEAVSHIISSGLANTVPIDSTILTTLGYDAAQQADLFRTLGIPADTKPTVKEFQKKVDQYISDKQEPIERDLAVIRDPSSSMAARQESLERLRDEGYTGMLSSASELKAINDTVQVADKIMFNGKETTIDEALSDKSMAGVVAGILDGSIDAEDVDPELVALVTQHAGAFEGVVTELRGEVDHFNEVQTKWKDAISKLSPDELKLIPGYSADSKFYAEAPSTANLPAVIKTKLEGTAEQRAGITSTETALSGKGLSKTGVDTIMQGLDADAIALLTDPGTGAKARDELATGASLQYGVDKLVAKNKATPGSVTVEDAIDAAFGAGTSDNIDKWVANLERQVTYGATPAEREAAAAAISALDVLHSLSGKPDELLSALDTLTNYAGVGGNGNPRLQSLTDAINNARDMSDRVPEGLGTSAIAAGMKNMENVPPEVFVGEFVKNYNLVTTKNGVNEVNWEAAQNLFNQFSDKPEQMNAVLTDLLNTAYPGGFSPSDMSLTPGNAARLASTTQALTELATRIPDDSPLNDVVEAKLRDALGVTLSSDTSEGWSNKVAVANTWKGQGFDMKLSTIPEVYRSLFTTAPDGKIYLKDSQYAASAMKTNPLLQDFMGAYRNWSKAYGSNMSSFLNGLALFADMGGVPYSPGAAAVAAPAAKAPAPKPKANSPYNERD